MIPIIIIIMQICIQLFVSYMITMRLYDAVEQFSWHTLAYVASVTASIISTLFFAIYIYMPSNTFAIIATVLAMISGAMIYVSQWYIYDISKNHFERLIFYMVTLISITIVSSNMIMNEINYDKLFNMSGYTRFTIYELINMTIYVAFFYYCILGTIYTAATKIILIDSSPEVSRIILILITHIWVLVSLSFSYLVVFSGYMNIEADHKELLSISSLFIVIMILWQVISVVLPDRLIRPLLLLCSIAHRIAISIYEHALCSIHQVIVDVLPDVHLRGAETIFDKRVEVDDGRRILRLPASAYYEAKLLLAYQQNRAVSHQQIARTTDTSALHDIAVAFYLRCLHRMHRKGT